MSVSTHVLIRTGGKLKALREGMSEWLGITWAQLDDPDVELHRCEYMGLELVLGGIEGFEDDGEVQFSKYHAVLSLREIRGVLGPRFRGEWIRLAPLLVGEVLATRLNCECAVVEDLARVVMILTPGVSADESSPASSFWRRLE